MTEIKSGITKDDVLSALSKVSDSTLDDNIVASGLVSSVIIRGSNVGFAIEVDIENARSKETLRQKCEEAVKKLKGVESVTAVLTSSIESNAGKDKNNVPRIVKGGHLNKEKRSIPGVKNIILVASGKGGVGKSTVAVNIAAAIKKHGLNSALLDADIYGPSIPKMMGVKGKPKLNENKYMIPKTSHGIPSISIGYLVDEDIATVWRGPMASKALYQLFLGTAWEDVDMLVVDMPPGTGDIQLSLSDNFNVRGVILVSTPQDVAVADVIKANDMFRKTGIPVLGVIENMSYFDDPSGGRNYIFGRDGVKKFAEKEGLPFLGEIPIKTNIREGADSGKPAVFSDKKVEEAFVSIIDKLGF